VAEAPCDRLLQDRESAGVRIRFLQTLDGLARRHAKEINRIDQPVADLIEWKAEHKTGTERRQHDLCTFLGAVGLADRVSAAHAGEKGGAGGVNRASSGRVLDA
jgi:hypothetical protein